MCERVRGEKAQGLAWLHQSGELSGGVGVVASAGAWKEGCGEEGLPGSCG